jgi:hypothetical protein
MTPRLGLDNPHVNTPLLDYLDLLAAQDEQTQGVGQGQQPDPYGQPPSVHPQVQPWNPVPQGGLNQPMPFQGTHPSMQGYLHMGNQPTIHMPQAPGWGGQMGNQQPGDPTSVVIPGHSDVPFYGGPALGGMNSHNGGQARTPARRVQNPRQGGSNKQKPAFRSRKQVRAS